MVGLSSNYVLVIAVAAVPVIWAAISDLRRFEIPNGCSLALIALYAVYLFVAPVPVDITGALVAAGCVFALTFALYLLGQFGGGDVKLMSALSLWAGPAMIVDFLLVTTLAGGVLSLLFLTRARFSLALALDDAGESEARETVLSTHMPYGLAIACGGVYVLLKLVG